MLTDEQTVIDVTGDIEVPEGFNKQQESSLIKSFSSSIMQLPAGFKLSSPGAREWLQHRKEHLKPWLTFVSTSKFHVPSNPKIWTKRVVKNANYFQSNYMFVSIGLIMYCLLTSPLLLIAVAASLGGCYVTSLKNAEKQLVLAGREIPLVHQYAGIGLLSIPIFYLAGATTAIFWVIGASFFVIMLHASLFDVDSIVGSEDQPFDLQMEENGLLLRGLPEDINSGASTSQHIPQVHCSTKELITIPQQSPGLSSSRLATD